MRRTMALIIACVGLSASAPPNPERTPQAQAKLDKVLAGRFAGETRRCLQTKRTEGPVAIDDRTMLFKDGPRIWRTELQSGFNCSDLGGRKFVMTIDRPAQLCSGDKLYIIDLQDGSPVGSCVLGSFTLYSRP